MQNNNTKRTCCDDPQCAKCLGGRCNDDNCEVHSKLEKIRRRADSVEEFTMGKFKMTKINYHSQLSDQERKIFNIGRKPFPRMITPTQAIFDQKVRDFDALPNVQVICDKMKAFILAELDDLDAIENIVTEFNLDKEFITEFYPMAKKSVLDKREVGLL